MLNAICETDGLVARLLLIRHAQSTWNAEGRWQGWADPPLSAEGVRQAAAAAARLGGLGLERVVSSDLARAQRTAEVLAGGLGLGHVEADAGWRERNVGEWSGLTRVEIEARWPGQLLAWREGRLERPPGGEAQAELEARVRAGLERAAGGSGVSLVVTHGGVIHTAERLLGVEVTHIGNLGGRWVEDGGAAGEAFTTDAESPAGHTTVL